MQLNNVFNENNQIIIYHDIERFVDKMRTEWEVNYYLQGYPY